MSWSIGWDHNWKRDIGYGVPAYCDHPDCNEEIDRGLGYVCGGGPYGENLSGGPDGCGLFFCGKHLSGGGYCEKCPQDDDLNPFPAKPDHPKWIQHKLTHPSWKKWRDEHPQEVEAMRGEKPLVQPGCGVEGDGEVGFDMLTGNWGIKEEKKK